MGWELVPNTTVYNLRNMSAGWFPGRPFNDIPGKLEEDVPIGSQDCNNVIWYNGGLRKFFGYNQVTTSPLNGGASVTSVYYSPSLNKWVTTAGNKAYSGADSAVPTDITGAVTITAGNNVRWSDYQFSTTSLIIGTNGVDAPFKWTGSGNLAVLGGSPPTGRWGTTWQNSFWIANITASTSTLRFSNLGDPQVWDAQDSYNFDSPITGLEVLGDKLVVFMDDHIGVLQGTNNRLLTKVERYITNIGCSGGHTISPAKIDGRDVLIFHSWDGYYIFDGSTKVTKVSSCIQNKYTGGSGVELFNDSKFSIAWGTYSPKLDWYIVGMASGADTTNLFGMVLDLKRPMETSDGIILPHWPLDGLTNAMNCVATQPTTDLDSSILFGSTDGLIYNINPLVFSQDGAAYTAEWKSKTFDMTANTLIQEVNVLSEDQTSSSTLTVYVDGDIGTGDGISDTVDFSQDADRLDVDFILGSSALASANTSFKNIETGNFGRFINFKVKNAVAGEPMVVNMINFVATNISIDSNVGN